MGLKLISCCWYLFLYFMLFWRLGALLLVFFFFFWLLLSIVVLCILQLLRCLVWVHIACDFMRPSTLPLVAERDSERGRKRKWKFWLSKELKVDFFSFFLHCHSWKVLHKVLYLGFGVRWKRNMRIYIYIYIELFESLEAYSWSWIEIFIYFLNEWI